MSKYVKHDVFLSYPRAEVSECSTIAEAIDSWGRSVFFDENTVRLGSLWAKEADTAITTVSFAVICIGPDRFGKSQEQEFWTLFERFKEADRLDNLIPYPLRGMDWLILRKNCPNFLKYKRAATTLEQLRELLVGKKPEAVPDLVGEHTLTSRDTSMHWECSDPEGQLRSREKPITLQEERDRLPSYSTSAELRTWLSTQEQDHNLLKQASQQRFLISLPSNPDIYTAFAEQIACEDPPNPWLERLLLRGFVEYFETPAVNEGLRGAFDRWLCFIHPAGSAMRGTSDDAHRIEKNRERLQERLGQSLDLGELEFAGYRFTVVEDPGLLRLGQLALAVMSCYPQSGWIDMIAKGCVAEAVMDYANKYNLFAWVVRTASEPWEAVKAEAKKLLAHDNVVSKQAAYRLLRFQGSEEAAAFRVEAKLDEAELFPIPPDLVEYDAPCYRPWRLADCEPCLERSDLKTMFLVGQLKPWFPEPKLTIPSSFIDRLVEEIDKISPETVWKSLWRDHSLEMLEGALCAAAPEIYAQLIRLVAAQERKGEALWRWTLELREHSLLLRKEEQQIVYRVWKRLSQEQELDSQERNAEKFLFTMTLPQLAASDQLTHILQRPEGPELDLLRFETTFQPLTGAEEIINILLSDADATPVRIARVLWFLSSHAETLPAVVVEQASRFLSHESYLVRFNVLCLLHSSNHPFALEILGDSKWSYTPDNEPIENHWGSLLLATRGHHLSFGELTARIDPAYLGYAVQKRGFDEDEIRQYSEELHRVWEGMTDLVSQPLGEFPRVEIDAPVDPADPVFCLPALAMQTDSQLIAWMNPHAYWGLIPDKQGSSSGRLPWEWPSEEEEQKSQRSYLGKVERQRRSGNVWFGRVFYTNAFSDVVKLRPDLVDRWLNADGNLLRLASTFYEALCSVLLREAPEKGIDLYRRLKEEELPVRVGAHGIERLDFFLFKAPQKLVILQEWERRLDECRTDRELLELVVVAEHGNGNRWLSEVCRRDLASAIIWKRARSLILLGLSSAGRSPEILKEHTEQEPECWLTEVARRAERYRRLNEWARHQYSIFIKAEDDVSACAAFRLFLRCVDRRFWLWWRRFEELLPELPSFRVRRAFFENNRDTIKNRIRENEKTLDKVFLGTKVLAGEVDPWLEETR